MERSRTRIEGETAAQTRYCALEYRSPEPDPGTPDRGKIVFLLWETPGRAALVLRNPRWRDIAAPTDHAYLEELFKDFRERSQVDAESLFAQASELSVGPVVTHCAGRGLENAGWLAEMRERFVGA